MAHFFDPVSNAPVSTFKIPTAGMFQIGLWGGGPPGPLWNGRIGTGRLDVTSLYVDGWTDPVTGFNPFVNDPAIIGDYQISSDRRLLTISAERLRSSRLYGLYYGSPYAEPVNLVRVPVRGLPKVLASNEANARALIIKSLIKFGISNRFLRVGILSVVSTEGGFRPRNEYSYRNTPNPRLRALFGARLPASEAALDALKRDDVAFYEAIYGGKNGNTQYGDGYKYRGRGFNGITYKSLYERYSKLTGVDLVEDPDKLNEPAVAADCLAAYFVDTLKAGRNVCKTRYGIFPEEVDDLSTATKIAFSCNAGWGYAWWNNKILNEENNSN